MMSVNEAANNGQVLFRKVVHIVVDDKFIDMACREFEIVAPGKNIFVMLQNKEGLKYVKTKNVAILSYDEINALIRSDECSGVVFHSFINPFTPILKAIPAAKKVFWLGWGFDYYRLLLSKAFPKGLLLGETAQLMKNELNPFVYYFLAVQRRIKEKLFPLNDEQLPYKSVLNNPTLMKRVDYFCPVIDSEYIMAVELNNWFKPEFFSWNYGTLEDDFSLEGNQVGLGENILIGNSATPENNHFEVFSYIKNHIDYSSSKIIVPLSYGNEWYKKQIIKQGYKLFGSAFVPLVEFMGKDQYIEVLRSCGYVFMNHLRQQGLGNICITLSMGAKLYMNNTNPLYQWLINKGALIHLINSSQNGTGKKDNLCALTEKDRFQNAEVIRTYWGREAQRIKTKNLIDLALS